MIPYHQMTLAEVFIETQEIFESDKPKFLSLLESTIDLCEIVPVSFRNHFYASTGRPREYTLTSLLWALIIQRIFFYPDRFPPPDFPCLLKGPAGILRPQEGSGCFKDHPVQTGF